MHNASLFGTIILLLTGLMTYKGFQDRRFFEKQAFTVDPILIGREFRRLLTSGFLHVGWIHFGFNMVALLSFSSSLEVAFGLGKFAVLYFASLIGGNLLALFIHRNHGDYSAVGASGAISGVILSFIVLFPAREIGLILIPVGIKSWIFGFLFIIVSIFGIKSQRDNIGHEAHLGGGIVGVLLTPLLAPANLTIHWWLMAAILIPSLLFLLLVARNPAVLMIRDYWGENVRDVQATFTRSKAAPDPAKELDQLLDKIRKNGFESLSKKERERLEELSK
jgi:membrane associated rhomboid family serine protease